MLTKISKWSRIQDSFRITPKIKSLVSFAISDIPWKFQKDPYIPFRVILLTHRETNKLWQNHNLLGGSNNILCYPPDCYPPDNHQSHNAVYWRTEVVYINWSWQWTHRADGVRGSGGRAPIGSGGGGICWDKLAGLSWTPRRRKLAAATGRVVDDCDGDALLHSEQHIIAAMLSTNWHDETVTDKL